MSEKGRSVKMMKYVPRQHSLLAPEIQNPFVHKLQLGYLDIMKVTVMSLTIAPLRLILVGVCLLLAWPLAAISVAFRSEEDKKNPLSGWRKSTEKVLVLLGKTMTFFLGFHSVKIKGKPLGSREAPVYCVAPHSSLLDSVVLFYFNRLPSAISRVENLKYPVVSALLNYTQPVVVKREDPNSRQNTIKEIQRRAKTGGKWPQIIIFPEGTCTNRSCLISYKLGAFHPGVPVQPVCLRWPNKLDTVTWTWEGPGALTIFWLTLCQFNTNFEIEFLPVYRPSKEEIADPKLFANNVRNVMARALKIPITDHTYEDCRLMMKARKLNLPMETGLVEFQKLHKKLGVSLDSMQKKLDVFRSIDVQGKGHVSMSEFATYLQLPESESLQEVFELYDRNGSGTIDFREYIIGLSLVATPVNTDSTIELAFQLFDSSQQGYISQDDLTDILVKAFNMTDVDVEELFDEVDQDQDGKITFDEFKHFANEKPEYAPLFLAYQQMKKGETPLNVSKSSGDAATPIVHVKTE